MKKIFTLAFLAVMTLGSLTFVSCDKENDAIDNQTEQSVPKDGEYVNFPIDPMNFTDSNGAIWTVAAVEGGYSIQNVGNNGYLCRSKRNKYSAWGVRSQE